MMLDLSVLPLDRRTPLRAARAWRMILRLVSISIATLAGPSLAAAVDGPIRGGVLTAVVTPEPPVLVGAVSASAPVGVVASKIFDALVDLDENLKPRPELAESWTLSPDGLQLRLNLRKNVRWHDGRPFTSADVRFSMLEVWKKIHPHGRVAFANVEDVETPDPHTAIIRLSRPSPIVLFALNGTSSTVLPKHLYEGTDLAANPHNVHPVGTGPFRFKKWVRGDRIELERNPDYWDAGKPRLDGIVFRIVPDATMRAVGFERGDLQYGVMSPIDINDLERVAKLPHLVVETRGYEFLSSTSLIEFNVRRPILADVRVRRAIAHAIDRQKLLQVVNRGFGKVSTGPVPSSLARYYTADVPKYGFDPEAAEKLLNEAGFPRGRNGVRFSLKIDWVPFGERIFRSAEFIRQSLKRVGIEAEVRNQDLAKYFQRIYSDYDFDLSLTTMSMFGDPQIGAERFFWSENILKGVPFSNASGYSSPVVDGLIQKAHLESDEQRRVDLYRQLQRAIQTDLPALALLEVHSSTVHASSLHGLRTTPDACFESLEDAWLEKP
jgi:peptide/nickel transport system substrate-binding protein